MALVGTMEKIVPSAARHMLELHYCPGTASLAPHMLLEEIGAPHSLKLVDRAKQAHKSPEYLKLNPNGLIPVLTDGDVVLYESAAICLYLVDQHPKAGLAPPIGTAERAQFYKWLIWLTNTLQATLIVCYFPERWADDPAAIAQVKAHSEAAVGPMLDQLDAQLAGHSQPWLLGATFTAVDLFALMVCRWSRGLARPARSLPHLGPYLRRVLERPAVQRVVAQEAIAPPLI